MMKTITQYGPLIWSRAAKLREAREGRATRLRSFFHALWDGFGRAAVCAIWAILASFLAYALIAGGSLVFTAITRTLQP